MVDKDTMYQNWPISLYFSGQVFGEDNLDFVQFLSTEKRFPCSELVCPLGYSVLNVTK